MSKRQSTDRLLSEAQQALERQRPDQARVLLEAAVRLDKTDARPWLMLAAVAGSARERDAFLAQADRLRTTPLPPAPLHAAVPLRAAPVQPAANGPATISYPAPRRAARGGNPLSRVGLVVALLVVMLAGAYLFTRTPVGEALVLSMTGQTAVSADAEQASLPAAPNADVAQVVASANVATAGAPANVVAARDETSSADAFIPDSGSTAGDDVAADQPLLPEKQVAAGGQALGTWTPTPQPTPTLAPTATPTATPEPTATPVPPPPGSPRPAAVGAAEKWIDVNLTTQTLVAYEGDTSVLTTLISSGAWQYPTVTGEFRTYLKYETQLMNGYLLGYDYYTPDVPSVMYFYEDYAIHGAYWHNNFGTPVSHGCVNATPADAAWLFNWAPLGTFVNVHY